VALTAIALLAGLVLISAVSPPWTLPFRLFVASAAFGGGQLPVWLLVLLCGLDRAPLASVLGLIEPLVAAITGWLLLGQVLTTVQIAGGVVLLGGALTVRLNSRAPVSELALVRPG
jgi:drug/metabolite transporter (DMT)-like permease